MRRGSSYDAAMSTDELLGLARAGDLEALDAERVAVATLSRRLLGEIGRAHV